MPASSPKSARSLFSTAFRLACASAAMAAAAACSSVSLDEPLEGTPWRLVQLGGQQVLAGADPAIEPRILFDGSARRISGTGGCNNISGAYRMSGSSLRIGPVASTRKACIDASRNALETRFLSVLEGTTGYNVKGGQLTLLDGRSMPLAVLELGTRGDPPP
jgi:heat shock protein HslJ